MHRSPGIVSWTAILRSSFDDFCICFVYICIYISRLLFTSSDAESTDNTMSIRESTDSGRNSFQLPTSTVLPAEPIGISAGGSNVKKSCVTRDADSSKIRFQLPTSTVLPTRPIRMKRGIDTVADNESTGSKKRVGGAALNEFLENRIRNMQNVNTISTTVRTPPANPDTNVSRSVNLTNVDAVTKEFNPSRPTLAGNASLEGNGRRGRGPSFDKLYGHIRFDFENKLSNVKENLQPRKGRRGRGPSFDKLYGHIRFDFENKLSNIKENLQPSTDTPISERATQGPTSSTACQDKRYHQGPNISQQFPSNTVASTLYAQKRRGRGPGVNNIINSLFSMPEQTSQFAPGLGHTTNVSQQSLSSISGSKSSNQKRRGRGPGTHNIINSLQPSAEQTSGSASGLYQAADTPQQYNSNKSSTQKRRGRGPGINNVINKIQTPQGLDQAADTSQQYNSNKSSTQKRRGRGPGVNNVINKNQTPDFRTPSSTVTVSNSARDKQFHDFKIFHSKA